MARLIVNFLRREKAEMLDLDIFVGISPFMFLHCAFLKHSLVWRSCGIGKEGVRRAGGMFASQGFTSDVAHSDIRDGSKIKCVKKTAAGLAKPATSAGLSGSCGMCATEFQTNHWTGLWQHLAIVSSMCLFAEAKRQISKRAYTPIKIRVSTRDPKVSGCLKLEGARA